MTDHSHPTKSKLLTVSAFNAGIAASSSIAGYTLDSSLGAPGPATVAAAMVGLGLVPLIALAAKRVRRPSAVPAPCRTPRPKEEHVSIVRPRRAPSSIERPVEAGVA
jgi:hypothetical protein